MRWAPEPCPASSNLLTLFGSVRATNVYEEKSLGIYRSDSLDEDELDDDAHWNRPSESRVEIWGRYLMRHARRQLSFGKFISIVFHGDGLNVPYRYVVAGTIPIHLVHR